MNIEFVKVDPDPTAEELADQLDSVADRYEELGWGEDDVAFLRNDAAERRRLSDIIRTEQAAEEEEIRKIQAARRKKKAKKSLKSS